MLTEEALYLKSGIWVLVQKVMKIGANIDYEMGKASLYADLLECSNFVLFLL